MDGAGRAVMDDVFAFFRSDPVPCVGSIAKRIRPGFYHQP
nr:MAG TPA_asm: hypothetical protein [Caudoviricetes sp.]